MSFSGLNQVGVSKHNHKNLEYHLCVTLNVTLSFSGDWLDTVLTPLHAKCRQLHQVSYGWQTSTTYTERNEHILIVLRDVQSQQKKQTKKKTSALTTASLNN